MADFPHPSRKLTVSDGLIVGLLLLAAVISACFMLFRDTGTACTIRYGETSETVSLSGNRVIPVHSNGYSLTVVIENGAVSVAQSNCPDGVCVNSGSISRAGQAIVCVPAGVTVRIDGNRTDDADIIAGGAP